MKEWIERILKMEEALEEATEAVEAMQDAVEKYEACQEKLEELTAYYGGEDWFADRKADADGFLPRELKRGVLSEDSVYDLLMEHDEVMRKLQRVANEALVKIE